MCRPGSLASALLILCCSLALADTHTVPGMHASIQAAITAADNSDIVQVAPGTYYEHLDFGGKTITVQSQNPMDAATREATIIDGSGTGTVATFDQGENGAVLTGFTLRNGVGVFGGAVRIDGCAPLITYNIITGNHSTSSGGGICAAGAGSDVVIHYNAILENHADGGGGGIFVTDGSPSISHNSIAANTTGTINFTCGGGINAQGPGSATITANTIASNSSEGGGGLWAGGIPTVSGNLIINNVASVLGGGVALVGLPGSFDSNTISHNSSPSGGNLAQSAGETVAISNCIISFAAAGGGISATADLHVLYCDVVGNTGGNYNDGVTAGAGCFSANPLFVDAADNNFRLKSNNGHWDDVGGTWVKDAVSSPCIDAGDPTSGFAGEPTPNGSRVNLGYDGNTSTASRSPRPEVLKWSPRGTGIGRNAPVVMVFNVGMQRASVEGNLVFSPAKAGSFTWLGKRLTFTPATAWAAGRRYRVTLGGAARSLGNVRLSTDFTWTFQPLAATPALLAAAAAPTATGAQLSLTLAAPAAVTVRITNLAGRPLALLRPGTLPAGLQSILWNARSAAGTRVPAGSYLVEVAATSADGLSARTVTRLDLR